MSTQTIDMNDVTSVNFNNQNVNEIFLNGNKIWPNIRNTYVEFVSDNHSQFTLSTGNSTKNWDGILETSQDSTNWTVWNGTTTVSSSAGGILYVRGKNNTYITGNGSSRQWVFTTTNNGLIEVIGNIESLLDNEIVGQGNHPIMANYAFFQLFYNSLVYKVSTSFLPSTTLSNNCYQHLFRGSKLINAPELPASTLTTFCYSNMFRDCTSLISASNLSGNTAPKGCCIYMFQGCTALTTPPILPATTIGQQAYTSMFNGCTALTTPPKLPATTFLDEGTQPAQYSNMFNGCTNLNSIPALPAINLTKNCYYSMFSGCSKIKISTTTDSEYVNEYRIPTSGTGTNPQSAFYNMFANTGGTFTGTPAVNTTYYTSNTIVS